MTERHMTERRSMLRKACRIGLGAVALAVPAWMAHAQRIDNAVAVFSALDKVTARISKLEVPLNQPVQFGSLTVTPRACHSRPPTEPPKTSGFVEVEETQLDGQKKRLFSGWMFAESPGLNAVEHPVFDVWLTECAQPVRPAASAQPVPKAQPSPAAAKGGSRQPPAGVQPPQGQAADEEPLPPRRVRR
jgi:hypothetical protein